MLPDDILAEAGAVLGALRARGWRLATAESCTGGLIAAALTHHAGASDVLERGFVTYANAAKTAMLGVPAGRIEACGAVSEPVAAAMAEGALAQSPANIAIAVTGIAGPGGGSIDKPVGLVWFGLARRDAATLTVHHVFPGDRAAIRAGTVRVALAMLARAALPADAAPP